MSGKRQLLFWLFLALLLFVVALSAPLWPIHDPNQAVLTEAVKPPGPAHWFGTDRMGRDLFSRVIYGTRTSLFSTAILVAAIFVIGTTLGVLAGWLGGSVDTVIMRFSDIMVSFPGMVLAIAMAGIMGPGLVNAVIAITMVSWTKYARLARSLVLKVKHQDYLAAARLSGTKPVNIIWRYLLPAVLPTLIITAMSDIGGMMLELAGFSFLGLGAQSGTVEWGYMLNEGRAYMEMAPWLMVFPGLAIFITVMIFNLLGDSIRDILDPQKSNDSSKRDER